MAKFGWLSPVAGHAGSNFQPIVMYQQEHILPQVLPHFDSVWIADHFYGFDNEKKEGFLEAWTTLTWLAAKFPDVMLCHHVLGHGYRNPALTAKMAATLQVLSGGRFMLGIGAGWREDEYRSYGYDFPENAVRLRQLEEVVQICRLMWTEQQQHRARQSFRRFASGVPARKLASQLSGDTPTSGTGPTGVTTIGSASAASLRPPQPQSAGIPPTSKAASRWPVTFRTRI